MGISPDAIIFGLRLLEQQVASPRELARHLHDIARQDPADHLVALEERTLGAGRASARVPRWLGGETFYVPVDCPGCRARFRVRPEEVDPSASCPLCGEAVMKARSLVLLGHRAVERFRAAEQPAPYRAPRRGRRFAHFELVDLLGRGGAGKVYEARNVRTGRTVALKLLDFQPLEPAARSFRRLQREARVAAAAKHPNIVPVLDLGVSEGTPFIEMELVGGDSLRERVRHGAPLGPKEACRLCLDALAGLQALHDRRIVHGDVKPANILLDADGRARLTDFGIARFLEETTSLTGAGRVVGSPHFMAPEQWRGEHLSPATDLYSTGLVLYYLLTGRLPYEGETHFTLMYKHLHEPILAVGQTLPSVPALLAQAVRQATKKEAEERFGDAEEFAEALRLFLDGPTT